MKKVTVWTLAAMAVSLLPVFSVAEERPAGGINDDYFTISKITVNAIGAQTLETEITPPEISGDKALPSALINNGTQAWGVINAGQAIPGLSHYYASAVPALSFNWADYTGWEGPKEIPCQIVMENNYGMTVVDVEYAVSFYYGGHNKNGKGKYITNFTVKPTRVDIMWGFNLNMDVKISDPMNVATPQNPLAYLQADLRWTISSPIGKKNRFKTYGVYGDGKFKELKAEPGE